MNLFSGLEEIVRVDCPLSNMTWYGLGGNADYLITPRNIDELKEVAMRCEENHVPVYLLGQGSNVLVNDEGVRGAVVKLAGDDFSKTEFNGENVRAWAGVSLSKLVLDCVRKGLSGIECLTGIPGTVGGAIKMNAGGSYGDLGACVESVTLMDRNGGIFEKAKPELVFDYRWTNITAKYILAADLKLVKMDSEQVLRNIKEIWIYKKNSQPMNTRNAGCVFKNPRGLSAGALIDRAELKGMQVGGAEVSDKHANFIVANKGCKAADVVELISIVKEKVNEKFDVELELELEIW